MNLEALPIEVKESALTDAQKKILNVLYTHNAMEKAVENGLFFMTNDKLKEEAEIGSNSTLQSVLSYFITNNFIERKAGKQSTKRSGIASSYILKTENIMNWCKENKKKIKKLNELKSKINISTPTKKMGTPNKKCTDIEKMGTPKMGTPNFNCTDLKCTDLLLTELNAIRQENRELKQMLELILTELKMGTPKMGTPNEKINKCTTDIEIDINKNIVNDHTTSGPKNEIEVIEDTNNETLSLDELLNTTNGTFEVDGETIHTITPIRESLFIPVEDTDNDITSTDNSNINFEVCDSSEQREEEITNDINENKQQVELRSLTNDITSTIESVTTNTHSNTETILINSNCNNDTPFNPMLDDDKTPSPLAPDTNENKAVLSRFESEDNKSISRSDKTQQEAFKVANWGCSDCGDDFKNQVRQEYKRIIKKIKGNYSTDDIVNEMNTYFDFCRNCEDWDLCLWWYDSLEHIVKKYRSWYDKNRLDNAIYSVANSIMDKK